MRFFSNDAKDTRDDEPERRADDTPAAVPVQRAGSPWSDAPAEDPDRTVVVHRADDLAPQVQTDHVFTPEPGTADRRDPAHDDQVDLPLDEQDPAGDRTGAGLRDEGGFDDPHAVDATDRTATDRTATDRTGDDRTGDDRIGETVGDEGGFDDPRAGDPATSRPAGDDLSADVTPVASDGDSTTYAGATAGTGHDDTGHDDTRTDDTRTDDAVAEDPAPAGAADSAPVVAVVPAGGTPAADPTPATPAATSDGGAKPGTVAEQSFDSLFGADAAKEFQERWRDVQLRFVDSPKDATAEAAGLVDEAVDRLTEGLKAQKGTLHSDSEDTEKLRVELRGYRDMLNRVLSL